MKDLDYASVAAHSIVQFLALVDIRGDAAMLRRAYDILNAEYSATTGNRGEAPYKRALLRSACDYIEQALSELLPDGRTE